MWKVSDVLKVVLEYIQVYQVVILVSVETHQPICSTALPEFGSDKQILPFNHALFDQIFENRSNLQKKFSK